jgi:hypothetical protein
MAQFSATLEGYRRLSWGLASRFYDVGTHSAGILNQETKMKPSLKDKVNLME